MDKPIFLEMLGQLRTINRLRLLFVVIFVLISWLELISPTYTVLPGLLTGVVVVFWLFFAWFYRLVAKGKFKFVSFRGLLWLFLVNVFLDIGLITIGTCATGGIYSLLPMAYILYFGALEIFFKPAILLGLNMIAIAAYLLLIFVNHCNFIRWPVFIPAAWNVETNSGYGIAPFVILSLFFNILLMLLRSKQNHTQWWTIKSDNQFLSGLNLLSRIAIDNVNDKTALISLSDKIKALLGADNIYITQYDDESEQVVGLAADSDVYELYAKIQPIPRYENTLTFSVKQARQPLVAENIRCSPYISPRVAAHFSARSVLAAPMFGKPDNRFLGALLVAFNQPHYFSHAEIARIMQVIDILSLLISRIMLYQEAMHRAELLEKMAGQVTNLVSDLKHTTLLPSIVESARSLLQAQRAALHLQQKDGKMKCEYSTGLSDSFLNQLTSRFNQLAGGKILKNREYLIIPDVNQDSRTSPMQDLIFGEKFSAYAVFSLIPEREQQGALTLYWDTPHVVSNEEILVGKLFAERASVIIRSAGEYARATEDAITDTLTNLPNRRHLDQRIEAEIERSQRYHHKFSLLMIDLDGFKGINDTFGHSIGDSVLKQVAVALRRALRASDFLARYGGDEFSIILPETGLQRAMMVAEKLRLALTSTRLHLPQETQRYLSGCVGIAIYPNDRENAEEMLICADQRMYRAKRSGSGSIIYTDE